MSAAFAVSLFPYYNNVFFSAVFLPVLFQQFLPVPYFFLFRFCFGGFPSRPSRCSIFSLPKNFLLLFSCLLPNFFPKLLPASPVGLEPTCPPCFTEPLPSFFYFSLASSVFRKDLPVRNSVSKVFTIFVPCQHYRQPENRPVREPVSAPRRFSCQSFVQTLFSIAFALFSAFNFPCPVFSSLLQNCKLFFSPLPLFSFLSLFSHCL